MSSSKQTINWSDFTKVDIRIGTIISAVEFKEVKNPAYKIQIDFGEFGIKKTSAQITKLYKPKDLIGKQIMAVINFPPKQIATMMSECLLLGAVGNDNDVILLNPERKVKNGLKVG
jgi:tRNA-binding protein